MSEYIKKEDVLLFIEEIKCNNDIPKNYGTLLDIMRHIREIPTFDLESVIEQLERKLKDCKDYHEKYGNMGNQIYAYKNALEILKSAANAMNGKNGG